MDAMGELRISTPTLAANPGAQTLVGLDTWFWMEGVATTSLTGSSAWGLVAVATPDHITLDPGDGSGTTSCPWIVTSSAQCTYAYPRSSIGGSATGSLGGPAYSASVVATWRVHFERNGNPVTIPGAPATISSPAGVTAVQVAEVQAVVRR